MSEEPLIENRNITEPIKLSSAFYGSSLTATVQADFPLCEADYLRLTRSSSSLRDWATSCFLATVGGAFVIGGKFVAGIKQTANSSSPSIEAWEIWAVVIGVGLSTFLFALSCMWPSEKSRTLAHMKEHFSSNPRQHQVMKARK